VLQQLRLVSGEGIGGRRREVVRLDLLLAPQVVDVRLADLQPQQQPRHICHGRPGRVPFDDQTGEGGPLLGADGGEPARDPGPAAHAVRDRDRRDVGDLQHRRNLVAARNVTRVTARIPARAPACAERDPGRPGCGRHQQHHVAVGGHGTRLRGAVPEGFQAGRTGGRNVQHGRYAGFHEGSYALRGSRCPGVFHGTRLSRSGIGAVIGAGAGDPRSKHTLSSAKVRLA
jgi:hypothetical protein